MELELVRGDITELDVDAVVTAANRMLVGGGGVDGAVHRAAGPSLLRALRPLSPCPPGRAVVTEAFAMTPPVRWVVHAVGPRFGVDEPAEQLLRSAYVDSLRCCDEVGARSVAFPALSAGAYGYPVQQACRISVEALRTAHTSVERCLLVAFGGKVERAWRNALSG